MWWNYIATAFKALSSLLSNTSSAKGNLQMNNVSSYIIVGMGVFIITLFLIIYTNNSEIEELQEQVKNGQIAFEYQNAIIEHNRAKNEQLSQELKAHLDEVKMNFSQIQMPNLSYKEPKNECEVFIKDLARAYQK